MTLRWLTSPTPPLCSSTRRIGRTIHDKDLEKNLGTIRHNQNDCRIDISESEHELPRQPSRKAFGNWLSKHSFMSSLGKPVAATQFTSTLARPLCPERWEVYIVPQEEDERELAPLASKKVYDSAFK